MKKYFLNEHNPEAMNENIKIRLIRNRLIMNQSEIANENKPEFLEDHNSSIFESSKVKDNHNYHRWHKHETHDNIKESVDFEQSEQE